MPTLTKNFPQDIKPIKLLSFESLYDSLPRKIKFDKNFWIGGKMAEYGLTTDNLIFIVGQDEEPSVEMRQYFNDLVFQHGFEATVSNSWKDRRISKVPLYGQGELLNAKYFEVDNIPILTADEVKQKSPKEVKWQFPIFFTGSVVKNGWSGNDFDIVVGEPIWENWEDSSNIIVGFEKVDAKEIAEVRDFFSNLLGWKTHVGQAIMPHKEPVYLFKAYDNKKSCL